MIHFVIHRLPYGTRHMTLVEREMPTEGFSFPETWGLSSDTIIECVLHNITYPVRMSLIQPLQVSDAKTI